MANEPRAYIIEVLADDRLWTSMAQEYGRIMHELRAAPQPCVTITIYEWWLCAPINPSTALFTRCPQWKHIRTFPWTLYEPEGEGDGAQYARHE